MTQQPQHQPRPDDATTERDRRLAAAYLPIGIVFLVLAIAGLAGDDGSSSSFAFFPIGAAFLLLATQPYWKRPAGPVAQPVDPDVTPR